MFVLLWSDNGILTGDEKVRVYKTHEEAHEVMRREFTDWYLYEYDLDEDDIGNEDVDYGRYHLGDNEAYDETDMESQEWRIYEV